jgi:pyruvate,water dikinase
VGIAKRMFTGAVERWTDVGRPRYVAAVERWQARDWRDLPATELLSAARELAEAAIDAYGALVGGVIPAAWISEGLFTLVYKTLVKRRDDPPAPAYLMGFDSLPIQAEKSLYDLAGWARARPGLAAYLTEAPAGQLATQLEDSQAPPDVDADDWCEWQSRFQAHLQHYGHTIYNLDFANPVPADDPAPLLETHKLFIAGQGANPHARQQAAAERRRQATQAMLTRLKGLRLKLFRKLVSTAQRYAPLREDGLADVGLSYPLLRQMLRELGRRFAAGGMIDTPDDVFWLREDEVEGAAARLDRGQRLTCLSGAIPQRTSAWRAARRVTPPRMLPQVKFLGLDVEKIKAARARRRDGGTLTGVAASPGRVTAPARVLHGPEDFAQMKAGDVLVAAITTPAWTPLFVRAAAIVTDVGGPLSHGSIVAREYGIPAVLGTGSATRSIRSGQIITVDGSAGVVTLSKGGESEE